MNLTPTVSWYQSETHIFMEILLSNCKDVIVDYEVDKNGKTTSFLFEGNMDGKHYMLCFELFDTIVEEQSSFKVFDNKIKVILKKKNDDEDENEWPRLQKNKDLYKNAFKVNWDKMDFEEDMEGHYEDMMRQMQMQQMMSQFSQKSVGEGEGEEEVEEEGEEEGEEGEEGEEEGEGEEDGEVEE